MPAAGENPQLIGGIFRRRYQPFGVLDRNARGGDPLQLFEDDRRSPSARIGRSTKGVCIRRSG